MTDVELKFWHAVSLINKGNVHDALPLFNFAFIADSNWALLVPRLRKSELLICDDKTEKEILGLK